MIAALRMDAPEPEPVRPDPRDVYSPDQLYDLWRNYAFLDGPLGPLDLTRGAKTPKKRPASNAEIRYAVRRADVDRLFALLDAEDEDAATAIALYYKLKRPIDLIATREDVTERAIYQRISRGMRKMALASGWLPAKEARLHPYKDTEEDEE